MKGKIFLYHCICSLEQVFSSSKSVSLQPDISNHMCKTFIQLNTQNRGREGIGYIVIKSDYVLLENIRNQLNITLQKYITTFIIPKV